MAVGVTIKRSATGEVALLIVGDGDNVRVATEREVARRFDLGVGEFEIFEDCDEGLSIRAMSKGVGDQREWYLRCGMTYTICTNTLPFSTPILGDPRRDGPFSTPNLGDPRQDEPLRTSNLGDPRRDEPLRTPNLGEEEPLSTPVLGDPRREEPNFSKELPDGWNSSGADEPYSGDSTPSPSSRNLEEQVPRLVEKPAVLGSWDDEFLVSVVTAMMQGKGHSRCVQAARRILLINKNFAERVYHLPRSYNGDRVFELPPYVGPYSKGAFFFGMERNNDCFLWSKMTETQAMIGAKLNNSKNSYKISFVKCMGSLQCIRTDCPHFQAEGRHNEVNWTRDRAGKNEVPFIVGQNVPADSVICSFCDWPPRCVEGCPAQMYFVTPSKDDANYRHKSRVAMHVGEHTHLPNHKHSKEQRSIVRNLMEEQMKRSPNARPSIIKSETIKALQEILEDKVAKTITREEADDLDEMLAILSDKSVFRSMVRSIKKFTQTSSDLTNILELRQQTVFPFVQSVLFPSQGVYTCDRPHIFKMSTLGPGSGVDLVQRMQPGGDLQHSWVMSDVMHRCLDKKWLTMSAHVYDHFYRGLCTIFVCELVSEDTEALQTAWRVMRRVCAGHGIENVEFCGFIADNAQAGWNAIRTEFWGGKVNEHRERSDSFHWAQSVHRVKKLIIPGQQAHFKLLLDSLRDAANVIEAFRIFERLKKWWSEGNAVPGKEGELTTWLAWWIVRFAQWGNFIRLVSISPFMLGIR